MFGRSNIFIQVSHRIVLRTFFSNVLTFLYCPVIGQLSEHLFERPNNFIQVCHRILLRTFVQTSKHFYTSLSKDSNQNICSNGRTFFYRFVIGLWIVLEVFVTTEKGRYFSLAKLYILYINT